MRSEQDIRHALTFRPSPFHHHHNPHSESSHRDGLHRSETAPVLPTTSTAAYPTSPEDTDSGIISPLAISPRFPGVGSHVNSVVPSKTGTPVPQSSSNSLYLPSSNHGHSTAYEQVGPSEDAVSSRYGNNVIHDADIEGQRTSISGRYSPVNDPYQLSSKLKSDEEINRIKANTSKKRNGNDASSITSKHRALRFCAPFVAGGEAAHRGRKLQDFYKGQNENIERFLKPVDDHRREAKDTFGENQVKYKIAVHGSFAANVCLAALQVYAAVSSGSLALFTTMADALFDPMSNVTLMISNRAVNRVDARKFPSGKARIETAGNIVFCFLMTAVSFIIIVQSAKQLAEGSKTLTNDFHLPSIIAVGIAFSVKLVLFLYCFSIRNLYSQIRILWEDHRNDLIINGTGLMFSMLGSKVRWWIDPMGAIVISCLIIFLWLRTAWSEFHLLIGVSADTNTLQLITYICKLIAGAFEQILIT
jgi:divalent metal cation (Fe/Co/Zn/Cd) transporter